MDYLSNPVTLLEHYKVHILVFLLTFLAAVVVAHPAFLLTDEWVTANQLAQLNEGHQIILNEGKYGSFENGTPFAYFTAKQNYLAYSLALPIFSLPAEWLVYFWGDNFIFFIVYLGTFLLIALALTLNAFFPAFTFIGKWRWTNGMIAITFIGFFINLFYYVPFPLAGKGSYPEIMAVVLTNIVMFAVLAVMVYEILQQIFQNPSYAFFGTIVCVSCSSYLLWTNFCKDHVLVAFLFTAVILMMITFLTTENFWFFAGGFLLSGLLVWARPELGLCIFITLCAPAAYFFVRTKNNTKKPITRTRLLLLPLFTIIGAIPFFINNYLMTKNPFTPSFVLWTNILPSESTMSGSSAIPQSASDTMGSLLHLGQLTTNIRFSTFPADVYGIFFHPQTGAIGILPLIPVFLAAVLVLPVILLWEKIRFSSQEKLIIGTLLLLCFGVFCAYVRGIYGMNNSIGIFPDIRYLSPIYLPLTIIGLMIVRKIPAISGNPCQLVTWMFTFWIILIPSTLFLIMYHYPFPSGWKEVFPLLDTYATVLIFLAALIFMLLCYHSVVFQKKGTLLKISFALMCSLPLIWQIDASLVALLFSSGLGGYSFWLPVLLKICGLLM
jgi:hypothetical protein